MFSVPAFFFFLEGRNNVVTAVPYQQRLLLYVIIIILNSNLCDFVFKNQNNWEKMWVDSWW